MGSSFRPWWTTGVGKKPPSPTSAQHEPVSRSNRKSSPSTSRVNSVIGVIVLMSPPFALVSHRVRQTTGAQRANFGTAVRRASTRPVSLLIGRCDGARQRDDGMCDHHLTKRWGRPLPGERAASFMAGSSATAAGHPKNRAGCLPTNWVKAPKWWQRDAVLKSDSGTSCQVRERYRPVPDGWDSLFGWSATRPAKPRLRDADMEIAPGSTFTRTRSQPSIMPHSVLLTRALHRCPPLTTGLT